MSAEAVGRLAGDIASQFAHLPLDEAGAAVATHLRMFWDPRMRRQLAALVDEKVGLDPAVVEAVALLRGRES